MKPDIEVLMRKSFDIRGEIDSQFDNHGIEQARIMAYGRGHD